MAGVRHHISKRLLHYFSSGIKDAVAGTDLMACPALALAPKLPSVKVPIGMLRSPGGWSMLITCPWRYLRQRRAASPGPLIINGGRNALATGGRARWRAHRASIYQKAEGF